MIELSLMPAHLPPPLDVEPFQKWALPDGKPWTLFYRIDSGYLLRFPDLADFGVSADGLTVTCSPASNVSDGTLQHLYLNQVRPLALSRLGKLVFHASAVEVERSAIAFLGASGRGKSTLAANFATSGYQFLTDDALVVEPHGYDYQVLPSHPSVRLWADSQKEMLVNQIAKTGSPVHFTSKLRFLAGDKLPHCDKPRPLRRVYFLGDGSAKEITFQRLSVPEAFIDWVKNSFLLDAEEQATISAHFDGVAKLANRLPSYHLDYPRRFMDLDHLRQTIVEHATLECDAA